MALLFGHQRMRTLTGHNFIRVSCAVLVPVAHFAICLTVAQVPLRFEALQVYPVTLQLISAIAAKTMAAAITSKIAIRLLQNVLCNAAIK